MRKVHRILNNSNPNSINEIKPGSSGFKTKLRMIESENLYFKINVKEEVKPILISKNPS